MRKMFLSSFCLIIFLSSVYGKDQYLQPGLVVSTTPDKLAEKIFIGRDDQMPADGNWVVSIAPTFEDGRVKVPNSMSDAFQELAKALPRWYQAALVSSSGSLECFVLVNGHSIHVGVMNWLWVHWGIDDPSSQLRNALEAMGATTKDQFLFGLHDGFCFYLKHGEEKALEVLMSPAQDFEDRVIPPLDTRN